MYIIQTTDAKDVALGLTTAQKKQVEFSLCFYKIYIETLILKS